MNLVGLQDSHDKMLQQLQADMPGESINFNTFLQLFSKKLAGKQKISRHIFHLPYMWKLIFAGIYFHYFANLKGFVIINSTCSVLLSYICQLELNSSLHVELIITKPFKLVKQ